jgi:hypothetical protein
METIDMQVTTTPGAPAASIDGVRLVPWPAEEDARLELASDGLPRILLVASDGAPPEDWDDLEDWVRLPLDPDELRARARTLRRRARSGARPWFDDDQFLRVDDDRWIDLPATPRAVVALLVERFGELVSNDEIARAYLEHGGSVQDSARKAMIVRVRRRVAELGLTLHSIREAGYLLDWDASGATPASDGRIASGRRCSVRRASDETSP